MFFDSCPAAVEQQYYEWWALLGDGGSPPACCVYECRAATEVECLVSWWWSTTTLAINRLDGCFVRDRVIPLAQDHVTRVEGFSLNADASLVSGGLWCGHS